jgi:hypothetical protein
LMVTDFSFFLCLKTKAKVYVTEWILLKAVGRSECGMGGRT